jgi:hypothetical protein
LRGVEAKPDAVDVFFEIDSRALRERQSVSNELLKLRAVLSLAECATVDLEPKERTSW